MPNWCNNNITIKGEKTELNKLIDFVKGEDTSLDFEKLISNKESKDKAKLLWDEMTFKDKDKRWNDDFETFWFNVGDGHKWNSENWGTKWNSQAEKPQIINDKNIVYCFDTAWSPCEPIIKKLIQMFPKLDFMLEYEEWGMCFQGILKSRKGIIVDERSWNVDCEECPKCEITTLKPQQDEQFECSDCGHRFTIDEVKKDD